MPSVESRARVQVPQRPRGTASAGVLLEGLRFIWREKIILGAISLDLFAVLLGGAVALLPIYAKDILHAGTTGLGAIDPIADALELKDRYGVIKAQVVTGAILLVVNTLMMYFFAFPR